jgi:ubiquitin-conjugating enzyme E2 variant
MTLGGLVVNEIHRLAHRPALAGPLIKTLQEIGVIQSPRHHCGHHREPTDTRYCILTDWLNPILDRLRFWSALEHLLEWLNFEPNRGSA